jgi:hypothetical protein
VFHSPDVICLTETWLCPDISDNELRIDGFRLVRLDRDRHGGGVAMYIKNSLFFSILLLAPETEFLVVSICSFAGNVCIALAYRPPSSTVVYFDIINLLNDLKINSFSNFLFLGDLNFDVSHSCFTSTSLCKTLDQFGLHLASTGHTRVTESTSSTLDIIATSVPGSLSCSTIPKLGSSDHYGLLALVACSPTHYGMSRTRTRKIWRYKYADFDLANDLICDLDPSTIIVQNDVNASWENFNKSFLDIMNKCIPTAYISCSNRPRLSKALIKRIQQKNNLFTRAKCKPHLLSRYRKLRNQVCSEVRAAKQTFYDNLSPSNKSFWKVIKQINGHESVIPTLNSNVIVAETDVEKANLLSSQFRKSFNTSVAPLQAREIPSSYGCCPEQFLISEDEVFCLLADIDCSKASVADLFLVRCLGTQ